MDGQKLVVETTHLRSTISSEGDVFVRVGDKYFTKKARDLNVGDAVVIHNEGIERSLDDIIPVLEHSARYRLARDQIFETKKEGESVEYVPRFRALLLCSLAPNDPDLEAKILRRGGEDFSPEDYRGFKKTLSRYVGDVCEQTLMNWLSGKSIAPENWENIRKLAALNERFAALAESKERNVGFYADYQIYVGLHRTVKSYLAKKSGNAGKDPAPHHASSSERGKYAAEISMVTRRFFDERDTSIDTAIVTGIRPAEKERISGPLFLHPKPNPALRKGIVVGEKKELPLIDHVNEVVDTFYITVNALYDALNRYGMKITGDSSRKMPLQEAGTILSTFTSYALTQLFRGDSFNTKLFEANVNFAKTIHKIDEKTALGYLRRTYECFNTEMKEGKVDAMFGMEYGTLAHLIDIVQQYSSALPRTYKEWRALKIDVAFIQADLNEAKERGKRRELGRMLDKLKDKRERQRQYLIRTYELHKESKPFFYTYHQENIKAQPLMSLKEPTYAELLTARTVYESQGIEFLHSSTVKDILAKQGIPDAFRLYVPETFIGEAKFH